ncbi:hypothetical protein SLEP1_g25434 [Rubroshorea leprosula]|uniref:Uncharacterized protein n=1 Tax=Rubroshorea leprosula TaxID=152421 RepID=A0AAV5JR39_9ROSI|nr:hypothetical protein SLEP1_g25434 [Rubroshorea leprosula]
MIRSKNISQVAMVIGANTFSCWRYLDLQIGETTANLLNTAGWRQLMNVLNYSVAEWMNA